MFIAPAADRGGDECVYCFHKSRMLFSLILQKEGKKAGPPPTLLPLSAIWQLIPQRAVQLSPHLAARVASAHLDLDFHPGSSKGHRDSPHKKRPNGYKASMLERKKKNQNKTKGFWCHLVLIAVFVAPV